MTQKDKDVQIDRALIAALAKGDQSALSTLYDRHGQQLMGVATAILGNRRDAEDLVYDVFIEIWESSPTYDPEDGTVIYWLIMRVRRRAIMRLQALRRKRDYQQRSGRDPLLTMATTEAGIDLQEALECLLDLPAAQRDVVLLSYLRGYTYQEIADLLGVPIATIRTRASNALAKLRVQLRMANGEPL